MRSDYVKSQERIRSKDHMKNDERTKIFNHRMQEACSSPPLSVVLLSTVCYLQSAGPEADDAPDISSGQ